MSNRVKNEGNFNKKIKIDPRLIEDPRLVNAMPKSAGEKKIYSQPNPKQPFTIPKRKADIQGLTTQLDLTSMEYRQEIEIFYKQSFYFEKTAGLFVVNSCHIISNPELKQLFLTKKQELQESGRKDKELAETYAFLQAPNLKEAKRIAAEGMRVGNLKKAYLGDPSMGVCLQKHVDLSFKEMPSRYQRYIVVMFKVLKGRVKQVAIQMTQEPTPNYDCHVLKPLQEKPSTSEYHNLYRYTQYYLYEYVNDEINPCPRHILPFAILELTYKGDYPLIRNNSSFGGGQMEVEKQAPKPPPNPLPLAASQPPLHRQSNSVFHILTDQLLVNKRPVGKVRLCSYFTTHRPTTMYDPISLSRFWPQSEVNTFLGGLKRINCFRESNGRNLSALYYFMEPMDDSSLLRYKKFVKGLQEKHMVALGIVNDLMDVLVIPPGDVANRLGLKSDHSSLMLHCIFLTAQSFGEKYAKRRDQRVARFSNDKTPTVPLENLAWGVKEIQKWCTHHLSEKSAGRFLEGNRYGGYCMRPEVSPRAWSEDAGSIKDPRLKHRLMNQTPSPRQDNLEDNTKSTDMILSTPEKGLKRSVSEQEDSALPQAKRALINPPLIMEPSRFTLPPQELPAERDPRSAAKNAVDASVDMPVPAAPFAMPTALPYAPPSGQSLIQPPSAETLPLPPANPLSSSLGSENPTTSQQSTASSSSSMVPEAPTLFSEQGGPLNAQTFQEMIQSLASRTKAPSPSQTDPNGQQQQQKALLEALIASASNGPTAPLNLPQTKRDEKEEKSNAHSESGEEFKSYEELFKTHISKFNESLLEVEQDALKNFLTNTKTRSNTREGMALKKVLLVDEEYELLKYFDGDHDVIDIAHNYCVAKQVPGGGDPSPQINVPPSTPSPSPASEAPMDTQGKLEVVISSLLKSIAEDKPLS